MDPHTEQLVDAALRAQEEERLDGFGSANPYLEQLRSLAEEPLLAVARELRSRTPPERELSARVLGQSSLSAPVVVDEVRRALAAEDDPVVVRWLVSALQYSYSADAVPLLLELSASPHSAVRFGVPDALSSCTPGLEQIVDALARLMTDPSRDVRWSATYEARAWIAEERSSDAGRRLLEVASELAATEPDGETRALARACL